MTREIKVCKKWQGQKNVPSINLQGVYLEEYGFNINDAVRVEFYKDEIRIKKMSAQMILKAMAERNPDLNKLISEFDCVICE